MPQTHGHDLAEIEKIIQQAKYRRAKHMNEVLRPALKFVGAIAFGAIIVPWHAIRHIFGTWQS